MRILVIATVLLASVFSNTAWAIRTVRATIVDVIDGDTLRVDAPNCDDCRVRMTEIDAPEHDQPYGQAARDTLAALTGGAGSVVTLVVQGTDRYGRLLARVYKNGVNINWQMVRAGAVWVYDRYTDSKAIDKLEAAARRVGRGLWALAKDQRMPPWQWRQGESAKQDTIMGRFIDDMKKAADDLAGFVVDALD